MSPQRKTQTFTKFRLIMEAVWARWRNPLGVLCLYLLLAMSLMGPIASDDIVASAPDHANHTAIIVQARQAMEEGQFPLRVAPWQYDGRRYPAFQFYSTLPYMVGVLIYKFITNNPYAAYKMAMVFFAVLGGVYTYRCARYLTGQRGAALLAGAAYVLSPYLIANLLIRGAFTELAAQGVLPAAIYYGLRCCAGRRWQQVMMAGLWLSLLAATHIITFLFGSFFLGVIFLMLAVRRVKRFRRLLRVGAAYVIVCVLMMYFLAPMLTLKKDVYIQSRIGTSTPATFNWLTPMSAMIGPFSASAEPQPGRTTTPDLNPAVGWPVFIVMIAMVILLISQRSKVRACRGSFLIVPLLCVFVLALFAAWSPFDFWAYLPQPFLVAQFSYRLLTHVMWAGALLLAFTMYAMFKGKVDARHVMVGMVILGTASGSCIHTLKRANVSVEDLKQRPDIGSGADDYLLDWTKFSPFAFDHIKQLPVSLPIQDNWLPADQVVSILCPSQPSALLRMQGLLPQEYFKSPVTLFTMVNGVQVSADKLSPGPFTLSVTVPIPPESRAAGKPFRLSFFSDGPLNVKDGAGNVVCRYVGRVFSMAFDGVNMVPASQIERNRHQRGPTTVCPVNLSYASTVQLPVLYYPNVLEVEVDGKEARCFPTLDGVFLLIGVDLPAGFHEITVRFSGLAWANYLSLAGWVILLALILGSVPSRWIRGIMSDLARC